MKEIASFEGRNAKIFLARSARSHTLYIAYLEVGVLPAVCEAFIVLSRETAQNVSTLCNKVTDKHADKIRKYQLKH